MAEYKPPKLPQTGPMSVGSAFDAYIKANILENILGVKGKFDELFESQVEPQNRDAALRSGAVCYQGYRDSGACTELYKLLRMGTEINVEGDVTAEIDGVMLRGKPDLTFKINDTLIILDWKVNGYYAKTPKSPSRGYYKYLDGFVPVTKKHGSMHKDSHPGFKDGFEYNMIHNIEMFETKWAVQLATYSWLTGKVKVGDPVICCIDQICCQPFGEAPRISVAIHRSPIGTDFQKDVYQQYKNCWEIINSEHVFRNMTLEESKSRCEVLSNQGAAYTNDAKGEWLKSIRGK